MILQQTCPGKTNGSEQSFQAFLWNNTRYIIYGTNERIEIYTGNFEHVQTVPVLQDAEKGKVSAVAVCDAHSMVSTRGIRSFIFANRRPFRIDSEIAVFYG
ncbi:hypothetical protein BC936DRAFT_140594 [Jimgerdemannia flammicorona]|uniref:Uncharacterized protein n=1 Tax=Jimgerdemannia flammicorona TaxID=994334 RepID=A0A433DGV7_9FUNG|nr:hypothetical protein BC936DRAFT_140594 [Jimgerdemannia flammicorona]